MIIFLQIKNSCGTWITPQKVPGALLVNIGDMFQLLLGEEFKPTVLHNYMIATLSI